MRHGRHHWSDKDRNRGCKKKDKDHVEFLCELYEAQAAQGRYFVHELPSEASSRIGVHGEDHGHARDEREQL